MVTPELSVDSLFTTAHVEAPADVSRALALSLLAVTGMNFASIDTGGNCTALAATTETGHEILITDGDAQIPTNVDDAVSVAVYSPVHGGIVVADRGSSTRECAAIVLAVIGRIPNHPKHLDEDGTLYCDTCPNAHRPFSAARGLV